MLLLLTLSCGYKNLSAGTTVEGGAEQLANMKALRTAELAYDAAFDAWVAAAPNPIPPEDVDGTRHTWTMPDDFSTLGWAPDGDVTGSYWIELLPDNQGWTIHSVDWVKDARVHCELTFNAGTGVEPTTCVIQ